RHVGVRVPVQGGADDRDVQVNRARELGLRVRLRRHNIGARRQQENVVERESLGNRKMNHKLSREFSQLGETFIVERCRRSGKWSTAAVSGLPSTYCAVGPA